MKIRHLLGGILLTIACVVVPAGGVQAGANPSLGEVMWVGFNFCPRGWLPAEGQHLPISQNQALFSLYGTTYGGDGRTTFALPDLRGRRAVGIGHASGLAEIRMGEYGGSPAKTLSNAELPAHTHTLNVTSQGATTNKPDLDAVLAEPRTWNPNTRQLYRNGRYANVSANSTLKSDTLGFTGGGRSFPVMDPYIGLRACVAIQGVFPSR